MNFTPHRTVEGLEEPVMRICKAHEDLSGVINKAFTSIMEDSVQDRKARLKNKKNNNFSGGGHI